MTMKMSSFCDKITEVSWPEMHCGHPYEDVPKWLRVSEWCGSPEGSDVVVPRDKVWKPVMAEKDGEIVYFAGMIPFSHYINKTTNACRMARLRGSRIEGWLVVYVEKEERE